MLQIRKILIRGPSVDDASVEFNSGANIIAGESDTGKSFLLHCLDYIFGADELRKRIPEAEKYSQLFVEFENTSGSFLTFERSLSGGDILAHLCQIDNIDASGVHIVPRRRGQSTAADVTSVLFPFAGIPDARMRANNDGKTQRLTIRTFLPIFLIDEISVIEEQSPVKGRLGYDSTSRERMFAFMLSGKDDRSVIAAERRVIITTRLNAQIGILDDLIEPIVERLTLYDEANPEDAIGRIDANIKAASSNLEQMRISWDITIEERQTAIADVQRAESQKVAIDELLTRYDLLRDRYNSDLNRLDFIAEGAYYLGSLQQVKCPLCDQKMTPDHVHLTDDGATTVYAAARAEASKILAQRQDLEEATASLQHRRAVRESERVQANETAVRADTLLKKLLEPALANVNVQIQALIERRVDLESIRSDFELFETLRTRKSQIESAGVASRGTRRTWEPLPSKGVRAFCDEVEFVLRQWQWKGLGRVDFDEDNYDIFVDGQRRQSHGKGVRAVLYSAFVLGLLLYCQKNSLPHPDFVLIDSPLTSYKKKGSQVRGTDGEVDASVEIAFWSSLKNVSADIQIIIVENKEPPPDVAASVKYEWFAGDAASEGDRIAFIPPALT